MMHTHHIKKHACTLIMIIGAIYSMAWIYPLSISSDVAWLVECARRSLMGGGYDSTIMETSSPITFLMYIPIVWIHQWTGISPVHATQGWLWILPLWMIAGCIQASPHAEKTRQAAILMGIYAGYITLCPSTLGEKDIIGFMLTLPYAYRVAGTQYTRHKPSWWILPMIIGGSIKLPIIPMLLAAYQWKTRRTDAYAIILGVVGIMLYLACLSPWHTFALHDAVIYTQQADNLWYCIALSSIIMLSSMMIVGRSPITIMRTSRAATTVAFMMGGLTLLMLVQRKGWNYHAIPAWMVWAYMAIYMIHHTYHTWGGASYISRISYILGYALIIITIGNRTLDDWRTSPVIPLWHTEVANAAIMEAMDGWPVHASWVYISPSINDGFPYGLYSEHPWASAFPFAWFAYDRTMYTHTPSTDGVNSLWTRYARDIEQQCPYAILMPSNAMPGFIEQIYTHQPRLIAWIHTHYHERALHGFPIEYTSTQWIRNAPTCT